MGQILYGQANAIRAQGDVDAKRIRQKSQNELRGAQSELQRFSQSLGNKKILEAAGKNINAVNENIGRNLDAATYGDFMSSLAASEELGASTAMAAAAGIGGSSTDLYNDTIRTVSALQDEQSDRQLNSDLINAQRQKGEILSGAVDSMDRNIYRADLDFNQYLDVKKPSTFGNVIALGLAAGATYFGGPQAGAAVLSLREAQIASANGDFAGASQATNSAISMGIKSAQQTHSLGGDYWGSVKAKNEAKSSGANIVFNPNHGGSGGYSKPGISF